MKKIKELQKRSKLNEGRNFGIGFSILKKIGSKFETYLPFTACRDYFNDFIFVEKTKKEIGKAHGYKHKLLNCFKYKQYFYLGVNSLNYNYEGNWGQKEEAENLLISNYKRLESFLNKIEKHIGLKSKTTIEIDENVLIFKTPIYWSKTTPLISAYTLLIRCYFNINDKFEINTNSLLGHKPFIDADHYFIELCYRFYDNIKRLKYDVIDYESYGVVYTKWSNVHNFGIQTFLRDIK